LQVAGSQIRTTTLADVSSTAPTAGQVPEWNGSVYVPTTLPTGTTLSEWSDDGVRTAGQGTVVANATRLWSIEIPLPVSAAKITYTPSTADNTSDLYDIGVYSSTGTLLCHTGATAGTSFAPSVNAVTLSFTSACSLPAPGRYLIALTGNAATAILNGTGSRCIAQSNTTPSSGNTTSGGALNTSITPPADNWACPNGVPQIALHN